jgi:thiamine biosynthesis lipoprotein
LPVRAPLRCALIDAPSRRPAAADRRARWRAIDVDATSRTVRRPAGLRIDSGGLGKGLAADLLARRLSHHGDVLVDCGGDIAVAPRGGETRGRRWPVRVEHPLGDAPAFDLELVGRAAVATSGIGRRLWRRADGEYTHHLIDPARRRPAWTGLVAVTALAPTAVEAETRSKAAFLTGPDGARGLLRRHGGVLVHDRGEVEPIGVGAEHAPRAEAA